MICGLLGRKLGHSYSPQIHAYLAEYSYQLFEKEPEDVEGFLKRGIFAGINVTVPYKKDVIPYLDELTDRAKKVGAVNTVVCRNGKLIGHNTDYFGFETMVKASGLAIAGKKCLVLGSGGASNTVVAVLKELDANVVIISRKGENNYSNLHLHKDAALIVNTTPVGMYPNVGHSAVDLDSFPALEGVLDVIYNPAKTQLLLDAEKRGIPAINGLLMLVAQAKEASEWFSNTEIDDEKIEMIHKILRSQMENIVLVGMPGCGKSTIGKLVAAKTGKTFVDADAEIVKKAGMSIPEIFAKSGEEGFRKIEAEVLMELGKQSSLVIATGGGCVTRQENYDLLHQNGRIFWIKREISQLPTDGRPLSQANDLNRMYEARKPLYTAFADEEVINDTQPETAAEQILEALK